MCVLSVMSSFLHQTVIIENLKRRLPKTLKVCFLTSTHLLQTARMVSSLTYDNKNMIFFTPSLLLVIMTFFVSMENTNGLDDSLIDSCKNEGMLNLSKMNIEHINSEFIISSEISCLDLSFNHLRTISPTAFDKSPNLTYINLSNNPFSMDHFFDSIFHTLPTDSLRILVLNEIGTMRFSPAVAISYTRNPIYNLNSLYLQSNRLTELPGSLNLYWSDLKQLYLSNNKLTVVKSLNFPISLTHLDLSSNRLYEVDITDLTNLQHLDISDNFKILHICSNDCNRFSTSIKTNNKKRSVFRSKLRPEFSHDFIDYLDNFNDYHRSTSTTTEYDYTEEPVINNDNNFLNLSNLFALNHLNASKNKIDTLDVDAFVDSYNLVTLDLSFNNLNFIADEVFKNLSALKNVYINNNELVYIPHVCELTSLENFDLSGNQISNVLSGAFCGSPTLKVLRLNRNKIDIIKGKAFEGLASLKFLDLSHNMLKSLPDNWMSPQNKLETLLLQSNYFDSLSKIPLSSAKALNHLYLYNNTFQVVGDLYLKSLINYPQNLTLHLELMSVNAILT